MMLKRIVTTLNRLVAYLFTTQSVQTKGKPFNTANNLLVQSGQRCRDALTLAKQKPKRKPKVALADTTEQSRKQTQNPVLAVLGQSGLQREIRASQPVSKSRKRKPSTAQYTIAETSSKPILKPVLKINGKDGLLLATVVSKTPQRAKAAPTKKAKVAVSTTQGKKRTQGKTPAQTPTVRQRKVRGT